MVEPLLTQTPPDREAGAFSVTFVGASADYSRVFFQANDVLAPGVTDGGSEALNLYEWSGGAIRAINVLGGGAPTPSAYFGSQAEEQHGNFENVVSSDGSRVIWTDLTNGALYSSERGSAPIQVDRTEGAGASGGGKYLTASTDGERVFFTDESQLTGNSTAASGAPDLYEYNRTTGKVTDLSPDAEAGGHADVLGVMGASEDGSYFYFVARGALSAGALAGGLQPVPSARRCSGIHRSSLRRR